MDDEPPVGPEFPLMDWAAARGLQDAGMQCGAHSVTHPALADCSPAEARRELVESRQRLEDRLGGEVDSLRVPLWLGEPTGSSPRGRSGLLVGLCHR